MSKEEYRIDAGRRWIAAIREAVGENPPATSVWRTQEGIAAAAQPFARAKNHLLFPTRGGHGIEGVAHGREPSTLAFRVRPKLIYVAKVASMALEYIPGSPAESFITFELGELAPSGVYEDRPDARSEELVEVEPGRFSPREVWDAGYVGRDEDGYEIPLPESARLVHRLFNGRLMMVSNGSLWNGTSWTYSGLHDRMTNDDIREAIEGAVAKGAGQLDRITK